MTPIWARPRAPPLPRTSETVVELACTWVADRCEATLYASGGGHHDGLKSDLSRTEAVGPLVFRVSSCWRPPPGAERFARAVGVSLAIGGVSHSASAYGA